MIRCQRCNSALIGEQENLETVLQQQERRAREKEEALTAWNKYFPQESLSDLMNSTSKTKRERALASFRENMPWYYEILFGKSPSHAT